MATLGKELKGSSSSKGADKSKKPGVTAKTTMLKAKLRAMEEGDVARKLGEQSKRILLERFKAEGELAKSHAAKIEVTWLQILRMTTVSALRNDVELLAAQHERDCGHRDAVLRMLFDDLMAAEEQYRVALFNHLRQMDRLIEIQDSRITDLETAFDEQLQQLSNDFHAEMATIQQQHLTERRELRSLIASITEQEEAKAAEAEHVHVTAREEIRNRSTDRIQELSRTLDDRIMELEAAFEQAHVNYLHATDSKTEAFKGLVAENTKAEKRIQRRAEAVERAKAALVSLRNKMLANARDYEEKNESLAYEKAEQAKHVGALKQRLESFRMQSEARLQKVSVAVREARSKMDSHVAVASRILQAAERCRQLEASEDKIWPVPIPDIAAGPEEGTILAGPGASTRAAHALLAAGAPTVPPTTATDLRVGAPALALPHLQAATASLTSGALVPMEATAARHGYVPRSDGDPVHRDTATAAGAAFATTLLGSPADGRAVVEHAVAALEDAAFADVASMAEIESKLMRSTIESGELDALDLFWRRYNKALLERMVLERRKQQLREENEQLRRIVAQCVEGTSVSDAALRNPAGNPLVVVNGRTGVSETAATLFRPQGVRGVNPAVNKISIDAAVTLRAYVAQGKAM